MKSSLPVAALFRLTAIPLALLSLTISTSITATAAAEEFLNCRQSEPQPAERTIPNDRSALTQRAKQILHAFAGDDISAYFGLTPAILLVPDRAPNAYATPVNDIVISRGLLQVVESDAELGFVLAHELGHIMLHHNAPASEPQLALTGTSRATQEFVARELQADAFAVRLLSQAGFEPRVALQLLSRLESFEAGNGVSLGRSYPSLDVRVRALEKNLSLPLCGLP